MNEDSPLKARELFQSGYRCAESVLLAIAESQDIKDDNLQRIATGFCSGLSRTQSLCGAYTGGIMGISLIKGRSDTQQDGEACYQSIQQFCAAFEDRFGATECPKLLPYNISKEEGLAAFQENNTIERCYQLVEEAVRMALSTL